MKTIWILGELMLVAFLAYMDSVESNPGKVERDEAPFMAFAYYKPFRNQGYAALLVRPALLISGKCCGVATNRVLTVKAGALNVDTEDDLVQEREVTYVGKLKHKSSQYDGGVVLVLAHPFEMTSAVNVASLATGAPSPGKNCYFYQFFTVGGVSPEVSDSLQQLSVHALAADNCSHKHFDSMLCFGGFESLIPEHETIAGGAVLCDGKAVAVQGDAPAAARTAQTRLLLDLDTWRQLAQCNDVHCLDSALLGTGVSWVVERMELLGGSNAAAPGDGTGSGGASGGATTSATDVTAGLLSSLLPFMFIFFDLTTKKNPM